MILLDEATIIEDFTNAKNRDEAAQALAWAMRGAVLPRGAVSSSDPIFKKLADIGLKRWSRSGYLYIKKRAWKLWDDWRQGAEIEIVP